jgi:hypothetical protein
MKSSLLIILTALIAVFAMSCDDRSSNQNNQQAHPAKTPSIKTAADNSASKASPAGSSLTPDSPPKSRQPKRKYDHFVVEPAKASPAVNRLSAEFAGLAAEDAATKQKIKSLWAEAVSKIKNESVLSASSPNVFNGLSLPAELASPWNPNMTMDSPESLISGLSYMCVAAGGKQLAEIALERANNLPPTVQDIVIFQALNMGVKELDSSKRGVSFEDWEPLAKARNPLYRLLALRAAMHTTSRAAAGLSSEDPNYTRVDAPAKLGFYLSFLDESDPVILSEAIAAVATVPTPEARQAIEKFHASQQQRGDASLVQAAEEALRSQEAIAQATP